MTSLAETSLADDERTARPWTRGPEQPEWPNGSLHIWRAELDDCDARVADALSEDERERAERVLVFAQRQRWTCSRGLLRELLGRYLQQDPATVSLTTSAYGKPMLASPCGHADRPRPASHDARALHFNLSHSGTVALFAFSATGPVGIDVEASSRELDEVAIAARALGEAEARRLRSHSDLQLRRREFLRAWTRHEATLKCLGTGFGARAAGEQEQEEHRQQQQLWVEDIDVGPDAAAALAAADPPARIHRWSWSPLGPVASRSSWPGATLGRVSQAGSDPEATRKS